MAPAAFHHELDAERAVLVVHGEVDDRASVVLLEAIEQGSHALATALAVDLAHVSFLPSPAIAVLATCQARARRQGTTLTLVAPEGSVAARVLTICAIDYVRTWG